MKRIIAMIAFATMMSFSSFADTGEEGEIMNAEYQNAIDITASAAGHNQNGTLISLGKEIPVTVYYNDAYLTELGYKIRITDISTTEEGIPTACTTLKVVERGDHANVKKKIRYVTSEGECIEMNRYLLFAGFPSSSIGKTYDIENKLLEELEFVDNLKKHSIASIEIWIYQ